MFRSMLYTYSMENEPTKDIQLNLSEAMMRIQGILAEVSVMGANDSEFESFYRIQRELQEGILTPTEAIIQAQSIKDSKMDYH